MAINKNKVMEAAQKFVERGQVDKAIKEYLKVVEEDPKDVRVWLKIGDLYAKKGSKQEATDTYLKVAEFYGQQGFTNKAIAVYKQILKIDPRLISANIKLAELYRNQGYHSDALQQYEFVAAFYLRENKTSEALSVLRELCDLDAENVATRIKLAELYSKENMTDEAVAEFTTVADQLRAQNRTDDFLRVAERLVWHQPDNHEVQRELATLYLLRNDAQRALQKLQVCYKADPSDVETLGLLAQAFEARGQIAKTISVYREMARLLVQAGQERQDQDVYERSLMLDPDDADAQKALGRTSGAFPVGLPSDDEPAQVAVGSGSLPIVSMARFVETTDSSTPGLALSELAPLDEPRRTTGSVPIDDDLSLDEEQRVSIVDGLAVESDELHIEIIEMGEELTEDSIDELSVTTGDERGEAHIEQIARLLSDADKYLKYGLTDKALLKLEMVFELDPNNLEAHERHKDLLLAIGQTEDAIAKLAYLAEIAAPFQLRLTIGYLRELFGLDPENARGLTLLGQYGIDGADVFPLPTSEEAEPELPVAVEAMGVEDSYDTPLSTTYEGLPAFEEVGFESVDEDGAPALDLDFDALHRASNVRLPPEVFGNSDPNDLQAHGEFEDPEGGTVVESALQPILEASAPSDDEIARGKGHAISLEDELDEAEFFITQSLYSEAHQVLIDLSERYPGHPLVAAKVQELDALDPDAPFFAPMGEGFDTPLIDSAQASESTKRIIEPGALRGDAADRHWDLGLAYKEMGLLDQAIAEFLQIVEAAGRGVQVRLMLGRCHSQRGKFTEAVSEFKKGLYVEGITEAESLEVYYQIGVAYESLGDPREALYYLEKVKKRDKQFKDIETRVNALKSPATPSTAKTTSPKTEETSEEPVGEKPDGV